MFVCSTNFIVIIILVSRVRINMYACMFFSYMLIFWNRTQTLFHFAYYYTFSSMLVESLNICVFKIYYINTNHKEHTHRCACAHCVPWSQYPQSLFVAKSPLCLLLEFKRFSIQHAEPSRRTQQVIRNTNLCIAGRCMATCIHGFFCSIFLLKQNQVK